MQRLCALLEARLALASLPKLIVGLPEPERSLRHGKLLCVQEILVSPELLRQHNIPVVRMVQYPGEWIISAPGAYHSGFNHGYNCAESTNFATSSWLPFGAVARPCDCRKDSVQIQVRPAPDRLLSAGLHGLDAQEPKVSLLRAVDCLVDVVPAEPGQAASSVGLTRGHAADDAVPGRSLSCTSAGHPGRPVLGGVQQRRGLLL